MAQGYAGAKSPVDEYFHSYTRHLKERIFPGRRVRKVSLHGGFTCPNLDGTKGRGGCIYCDNRSFSPSAASRGTDIRDQLEKGMAKLRAITGAESFIAYFQPFSNTYGSVDTLRSVYEQALAHPDVVGLAIGTRPDCINGEVVRLLEELAGRTYLSLELGLQSANDATLERINRGHSVKDFTRAMELCAGRGFEICVHVILGLPGENSDDFGHTAESLSHHEFHSLKLHPLHVVKGTALARLYAQGGYIPLMMEEYVGAVVDFLERTHPSVALQRFTGDAPKELLVAPDWCRHKMALLRAVKAEFQRRGTRQGTGFTATMPHAISKRGNSNLG